MGFFGPKRIDCPANVWTTIISNAFVQLPAEFDVSVVTNTGAPIAGVYEEKKSQWIIPGKPVQGPLDSRMRFHRGYFNTFYSVKLCPTASCTVEVN